MIRLCQAISLPAFSILNVAADPVTNSYFYNTAGRLVAADYGGGKAISYAYDLAGNLLQLSTPAPGLQAGPVINNQVTLYWQALPGGFVLEVSPTLGNAAQWQTANLPLTLSGDQYIVTVTIGPGSFYRLRKP